MESLLRPLVTASGHTNEFKNQFLQKIFSNLDHSALSAADCNSLFKLFLEWILMSNVDHGEGYLIRHGHGQFTRLAEKRPELFREFINPNLLIDIFTNNLHSNKAETAVLIGEIIDLLATAEDPSGRDVSQDFLRSITNVARCHLANFLRDHGVHLSVAAALGSLYKSHPDLLPVSFEARNRMASSVVRYLAGYRTPPVIDDVFFENSEKFSQILPLIWEQNEDRGDGINDCLRIYYTIISTGDSYSRPSCALLCMIDKIPTPMLDAAMQAMIDSKAVKDRDEGRTVTALQTMIEWLTQRPSVLLSRRLMDLLDALHKTNRNSVLIEIAHATIEKLLYSLPVSKLQESVEPLLFYLLLGFQHSETVFHQIVTGLPEVFKQLSKSATVQSLKSGGNTRSQSILNRLKEAVAFLINQFPGFPELYNGVIQWLEQSGQPELTEERIKELKSLSWLTHCDPSSPTAFKTDRSERADERSATGMVGLINLGNTCYMNSVIQALFITGTFCDLVLTAPVSSSQTVLMKLQLTFAFLKNTMRAIYSPSDLLKVARPPWFESGRQQDCSEFLRYLLDTLHEQGKRPEPKATGKKTSSLPPEADADELAAGRVKPSYSTTALDAIAEDPENPAEPSDQTSRNDGTAFGSRSSLSGRGTVSKVDSDSDEEEVDMLGSRGSLSGGSLCRWTTEENLSFGGSREDKMDLVDGGPLHDSHSNSTDSGIQSVGDSIRGSSDSMRDHRVAKPLPPPPTVSVTGPDPTPAHASIVEHVFGGKLETTYQCSHCHQVSRHQENFTDLNLAFPDENGAAESKPRIQDLLDHYLSPEKLEGENQYRCDRCSALRDAVKRTQILRAPSHLMCTLMRFNYDRTLNRKSKVCHDVRYEMGLTLPLCSDPSSAANNQDSYSLYAVVVHSGYSSDGGHYYTYARIPEAQPDVWYVFNDSKVSYTSFDNFVKLSDRFPVDTAYVLFYQKQPLDHQATPVPLRMDLKMAVERDNIKFMREKERAPSTSSYRLPPPRKDGPGDDDEGPPSHQGCGTNAAFNAAGRFIC